MAVLSVDLGTSNTVAVLAAHDRPPRVVEVEGSATMPSAVFAADDGRLVVGREAERRARMDPARFEPNPKRRVDEGTLLLGDRVVPVSEAFAAVLGKVAEETSRQLGGARADEVRLTHPAQWGPVRRNVLLSAARQAGLGSNLVLVPEPVAAAAHFASFPGRSLAPGQALAVYDLGAGTFDVAIVGATQNGFTVLAEAGLPDLGGLDVDQALLANVGRQVSHLDPHAWQRLMMPQSTSDRRAQRVLREDVRAAKEALSGHPQTDLPLPDPFHDVLVTRAELEALIRPNLIRSAELLAATVRSSGLSPDRLAGVYLVGGSSRIPLVATLISEQLRIVPTNLDQPETAVALGAHHVPQAGTTLRTENLAGAVPANPSGERTTSIAPPSSQPAPAPAGLSTAAPPPRVPDFGPPPVGPPFRAGPLPPPAKSARRKALPWIIGAAALVVVITAAAIVIVVAVEGADDLPHAKNLSPENLEADCESLINEDQASEALGEPATRQYDGCFFKSEEYGLKVDINAHAGLAEGGDETTFEGNPAFESGGGDCAIYVQVRAGDSALYLGTFVSAESKAHGGDRCSKARAALKVAFANAPDA